ncbi:hypothetical protein CMMCAS05_02365 [Clavibacter michiganensis subsp. michiganensis]|nr:hypothetical protein CMMCAS05_02365 [Clavibacter michiganensis subsp. michiganensis]
MASYAERGRVAKGALRRTMSNHSSTPSGSSATAATVCCASTSSGFAGTRSDSICPLAMRSAATAEWMRSARCLGKMTPRETSPTWCPARPTRCSPLATEGGASTCTTRSTSPMSMPSSRLEVATTQRRRPDFRSSSMRARCSLETDPWCALASTGSAPSVLPACAMTSAGGRAAVRRVAENAVASAGRDDPDPAEAPASTGTASAVADPATVPPTTAFPSASMRPSSMRTA